MFDPLKATRDKALKAQKKKGLEELKAWATDLVPEDLRDGLIIDVNEVVCGDPSCAPVDTFFTLVWETSGKGVFALPAPVAEISREELIENFPVINSLHFTIRANLTSVPLSRIVRHWSSGKQANGHGGQSFHHYDSKLVTV
jgi:hypothetical protein